MQEPEKNLITLMLLGALIAVGKVLTGNEPISARLFVGRIILGSATSVAAGAVLLWVPGITTLGVTGLGAALGIAGHQCVELWLRRKGSNLLTGKGKDQ